MVSLEVRARRNGTVKPMAQVGAQEQSLSRSLLNLSLAVSERRRNKTERHALGTARFLNFSTAGILDWMGLCRGGCPVPCCMFGSIPRLHPLDASSTPGQDNQMSPELLPNVPWWGAAANHP